MMMVVTVLMVIILVNRGMCLCGNCYGDDIGDDHENMLLNMLNMLNSLCIFQNCFGSQLSLFSFKARANVNRG